MWVGGNQGAFFKPGFGNSICARFENDWVEMNSKRERGRHALTCPMQLESVLLANLTKTPQARRELSAYQVERWNEFYHLLTKMTILVSSFISLINVMWEGTAAGPGPLLAGLPARWQNLRGRCYELERKAGCTSCSPERNWGINEPKRQPYWVPEPPLAYKFMSVSIYVIRHSETIDKSQWGIENLDTAFGILVLSYHGCFEYLYQI